MKYFLLLSVLCVATLGCDSSDIDAIESAIDEPSRKTIDRSILGTNAFVNDGRFGSIGSQLLEVRDALGIKFVRVLFAWDDGVQPTPGSAPNFSFYDDIVAALPPGVDALVVTTGVPSWMADPANWIEGNPRTTFVELWLRKLARRYGQNGRVIGWQIWNEPDQRSNPHNTTMGFVDNAPNYVEMLGRAYSVMKDLAPGDRILNAATTSIAQDFPNALNYNKTMRNSGAESFVDVWAIHYYGKSFENFLRDGGVKDFLRSLGRPVWVTESGAQGVNSQLAYGEQVWPFLREEVSTIERIYQYQFTEATPSDNSYGMRTLDPAFPVSDLYIHLDTAG